MFVRIVFIALSLLSFLQANERVDLLEEKIVELTKRLDSFEKNQSKEPVQQFDLVDKTIYGIGGRINLQTTLGWPKGDLYADDRIFLNKDPNAGSRHLEMSARASRFWFKTRTSTKYGPLRTLIEIDFKGQRGNERTINGHAPRLRHAYAQLGMLTVGQTNSTFNTFATVDTISDIINDTRVRQPLVRVSYEAKDFGYDLAFENPETVLIDKKGTMLAPKDDILPDIIARVRYYPEWGEMALAVMGRHIAQNNMELNATYRTQTNDSAYGYGINFSTKIRTFGNDDIVLDAQYGLGLGRYMAYSAFPAGFISNEGKIKLQETYGWHVGYRHMWSKDWRSTLAWAYTGTKNNKEIAVNHREDVNKHASSIQANLLYNLVQNGLAGIEYVQGRREVQSGDKGKLDMVLLVFRYDF